MPIRCVLFDHDDTLLPTYELRVRCLHGAALEVLGHEVDAHAILAGAQGQNLESIALEVAGGDPHAAPLLVSAYRSRYSSSGSTGLAPYPGIEQTLRGLRARDVQVAVVTSKLGTAAQRELAMTGLDIHIQCLVGAEHVTRHKPQAEPLLLAMEQLGALPEFTLMVGDTRADILGAHNAGVMSAGALWGTLDRDALAALSPDYLLEQPADILALAQT